ncbi:hypothetical protein ACWGDT_28535 [Streptomyces avermitilis]
MPDTVAPRGSWCSGALHLDATDHARSTVCGSTADGMGAGIVVVELEPSGLGNPVPHPAAAT